MKATEILRLTTQTLRWSSLTLIVSLVYFQMKSFIIISVLAALAFCNANFIPEEDFVLAEESNEVFQKDYGLESRSSKWNDNDLILFYEELVNVPAIPNVVQVREVTFRGNSSTQINRIVVQNLPADTYVGNYWTHALVRLTSAPGRGINSRVQFFGRYSNWL